MYLKPAPSKEKANAQLSHIYVWYDAYALSKLNAQQILNFAIAYIYIYIYI